VIASIRVHPQCLSHPSSTVRVHLVPTPPHPRRDDHPVPHRRARQVQSLLASGEICAAVPHLATCQRALHWHEDRIDDAATDKQRPSHIGPEVQYVHMLMVIDLRMGLIDYAEDGKEMNLELDNMRITEVIEQVDRHSRQLARKEALSGN
jgi:hypothetical protein